MGSASIYWFPDKAILGVTSGISHRLECTGMRAVIFRYPTAYAHFLVGNILAKASPPGRDVDYAAVWTTYKF